MRKLKVLGNYANAYNELKKDNNNAVAELFQLNDLNKNDGVLSNSIITIKDNYAMLESKTKASSRILEGFIPGYDATIISKLKNSGANIIAKMHLDELALGGTGTYSAYGLITNPNDPKRYVGGSSSGSAATFSENISFAIGSDTGDSVRLPASFIGKVGFKPSYGAISRYGLYAYASSLDTVAYFTHNVNDAIVVSEVLFGKDHNDMTSKDIEIKNVVKTKPNNIVALDFSDQIDPSVNKQFHNVIEHLRSNGVNVSIIKPNLKILRLIKPVYQIISFSEASSNLSNLNGIAFGDRIEADSWEDIIKKTRSKKFGQMVQERLSLGSYFLYEENQKDIFIKAQKARRLIKNYYNEIMDGFDIMIYPASYGIAPLFEESINNGVIDFILTGSNLVGNPSITIPMGKKDNLSFSIAIDAKLYQDQKLLGFSEYVECLIGEINE
ncbi:amidase family protein [Mycoplasmopsis canis]|uniref:amidase family protein n=1 Tax=Mycoplasmopsis cynos TaxID=171284 RepID=UPI002AFF65BE|nr:amidase family protein [Mycoplasmopsis cynos]WQQ13470.1 amidase family protein [Mycoplasmopsis cynos]WQQ13745.1 amidase family protein [Mycoplasmopsis cynos]